MRRVQPRHRYPRPLPLIACAAAAVALWVHEAPAANAAPRARHATSRTHHAKASVYTATGTIASTGAYGFTVQLAGQAHGTVATLLSAANTIDAQQWPYVWGGGHAVAGVASIGERGGPGYNGKRKGFDCSGAVAAVLVAAGLWPAGTSVPNDAGVISQLRAEHLIARGAASGPGSVTLYDWPGVHIFMNIAGRFWGTSDGGTGANRRGGPGWLTGYPYDAQSRHYRRYHFLAAKLDASSTAGLTIGFAYPQGDPEVLGTFVSGDQVKVTYKHGGDGTMVATAVVDAEQPASTTPEPSNGGSGL